MLPADTCNSRPCADRVLSQRWMASRPANAPDLSDAHIAFLAESRRAAIRRQRWLAGISVAAAIVAFSLAGLAYFQRGEAVRQTQAADAALREAHRNDSLRLSEAARIVSDHSAALSLSLIRSTSVEL